MAKLDPISSLERINRVQINEMFPKFLALALHIHLVKSQ